LQFRKANSPQEVKYMSKSKNSMSALLLASVFITSCASNHNMAVYDGGKLPTPHSRINKVDIELSVDKKKLEGSATCTSFLFFTLDGPSDIAYGYSLQTSKGIKGGDCVGGAVYNAIGDGKADYLIGTKYDVKSKEVLCLLGACFYSNYTVKVSGYPGKIENIKGSAELDSTSTENTEKAPEKLDFLNILPFVGE
jgi:hypothetical protein